jgi:hypothetical protein
VDVADDGCARGADLFPRWLGSRRARPEQDTIAQWLIGIGQTTVMIRDVKSVELQQDLAVADDLLVLVAAVAALGGEYLLVEAARRRHVAHDHHRLWPCLRSHDASVGRQTPQR